MNDSINRQAAIDAIEKAKTAKSEDGEIYVAKYNAEMNITLLPSAQQDFDIDQKINKAYDDGYETGYLQGKYDWIAKKKGRWNFIGDQMFECTECGVCYTQSQFDQMRVRITDSISPNFCPNCGADMMVEEGEADEVD